MGLTAENVARAFGIGREEQDRFALASHIAKAVGAVERGILAERSPRWRRPRRPEAEGPTAIVAADDGPRADTSLEALAALPPAFLDGGTVTAGNSSPLTDGAAMTVVASAKLAKRLGVKPLAKIRAMAVAGVRRRWGWGRSTRCRGPPGAPG